MTDDLAAEGDRLHAHMLELIRGDAERGLGAGAQHTLMLLDDLAAALRERDQIKELHEQLLASHRHFVAEADEQRVRAETAEADADDGWTFAERFAHHARFDNLHEAPISGAMSKCLSDFEEAWTARAAHAAAVENRHAD